MVETEDWAVAEDKRRRCHRCQHSFNVFNMDGIYCLKCSQINDFSPQHGLLCNPEECDCGLRLLEMTKMIANHTIYETSLPKKVANLSIGTVDGRYEITMELCPEGKKLQGLLPPEDLFDILQEYLEG